MLADRRKDYKAGVDAEAAKQARFRASRDARQRAKDKFVVARRPRLCEKGGMDTDSAMASDSDGTSDTDEEEDVFPGSHAVVEQATVCAAQLLEQFQTAHTQEAAQAYVRGLALLWRNVCDQGYDLQLSHAMGDWLTQAACAITEAQWVACRDMAEAYLDTLTHVVDAVGEREWHCADMANGRVCTPGLLCVFLLGIDKGVTLATLLALGKCASTAVWRHWLDSDVLTDGIMHAAQKFPEVHCAVAACMNRLFKFVPCLTATQTSALTVATLELWGTQGATYDMLMTIDLLLDRADEDYRLHALAALQLAGVLSTVLAMVAATTAGASLAEQMVVDAATSLLCTATDAVDEHIVMDLVRQGLFDVYARLLTQPWLMCTGAAIVRTVFMAVAGLFAVPDSPAFEALLDGATAGPRLMQSLNMVGGAVLGTPVPIFAVHNDQQAVVAAIATYARNLLAACATVPPASALRLLGDNEGARLVAAVVRCGTVPPAMAKVFRTVSEASTTVAGRLPELARVLAVAMH